MTSTRDCLLLLHAEADRQHIHFEKSKRRRAALAKGVNAAIALTALAAAAASAAEMPSTATITFAMALLIAATLNLFLTDRQQDRDLYMLSDAWRRHRTDAARLLARDGVQRPDDTAEKIKQETSELECRIAETRTDSRLHGLPSR